jgi:2-methylcitrate dehydratase PrpD
MSIIDVMTDWAGALERKHSTHTVTLAKHAIEDTVGCMIAGSGDSAAAAVRSGIARVERGGASMLGGGRSLAAFAALANGMSAHALDYDDVLIAGGNHPSAVLVAALLALAESEHHSGAALIDAFIVGVQLQVAVARALMPEHYEQGWHTTSTVGCIGSAGACARLLGLERAAFGHALSLSASMAGGTKTQFGTPAKPLHAGLAAQHAVEAAQLARAGVTGSPGALDGRMGIGELMYPSGGKARWSLAEEFIAQGKLALEGAGLMFKRYPCCGSNARVLDVILALREREPFTADDVQAVEAEMADMNVLNLMYHAPRNELEGRFSLHYSVALALEYGSVTLSDFIPGAVDRPRLRALLGITSMRGFGAPNVEGKPDVRRPHVVRIKLKDGRTLVGECADPKGTNKNPFSDQDRKDKFADCASWILPPQSIARVRKLLGELETLERIDPLMECLAYQCGGDEGQRFASTRPAGGG